MYVLSLLKVSYKSVFILSLRSSRIFCKIVITSCKLTISTSRQERDIINNVPISYRPVYIFQLFITTVRSGKNHFTDTFCLPDNL